VLGPTGPALYNGLARFAAVAGHGHPANPDNRFSRFIRFAMFLSKGRDMSLRAALPTLPGRLPCRILILAGIIGTIWTSAALAQRPLGIDVSAWQGDISQANWNRIYNEGGRRFAFIRVTHYGASNGDPDSYYAENFTRARAAGLLVGPYHYAIWSRTPQVEANYFLTYAAPYITAGYLPPMLDLESKDNPGSPVGATSVCDWAKQWLDIVKAQTGVDGGVYLSGGYINSYGKAPSGCSCGGTCTCCLIASRLWVADWCGANICTACGNMDTAQPEYGTGFWPTWLFWQYCSTGSVPGISGNADLDVFNGTYAQLQAQLIGVPSQISRSPASLTPTAITGLNPSAQTFTVHNSIQSTMNYNITFDVTWLDVMPTNGDSTGPGDIDTITVTYSAASLPIGIHSGTITITAAGASNSPQTIPVTLTITPVPGDFNADGHIDGTDTNFFVGCITGQDTGITNPDCTETDLDNDDDVDQEDFGILQRCYSGALNHPDPYCAG
jgi:GH25 family lysozyme M1 (1,4-beta-N-acetylmuramidase)